MRDGEVCVCFFAGALGTNNPKISRHLAYLKRAGLVNGRRDGKWMHYSIVPPTDKDAAAIFEATMQMLRNDKHMTAERKQFAAYCCSPSAPVMIQGRAVESIA
jgi:ArsR family transcriptional regulator